ncbi:methyl-accepting chemotaxis protein [Stenotrophomonas sp. CFBP 13725]|uniref:methyl-accepting chemotaxis protein n=1 Tax=Stenotrophomonas sp. CFBP 13725 TaxID=2775297 RepID=UPI001781264B|nr:methyl-accepting chemotaxis protein [Stenotrophomonas sp. CFBP 13725]MBD8637078.1 HAMP domain-containing protein [Stenotrophomonas sp. CFBP 13725]
MSAVPHFLRTLGARVRGTAAVASGHTHRLGRLSVAAKIKGSLLVCGIGLVTVAAMYAWTTHVSDRAARTFAVHQQGTGLAATLAAEVAEARRLQTQYALTFDASDRASLQQAQQRLQATLEQLRALPMDGARKKVLDEVASHAAAFSEGIAGLNARVDEMGRGDEALAVQLDTAADALQSAVDATDRPLLAMHVQKMRRQESLLLLNGDSSHADKASEEKLPFDLALAGLSADTQQQLRELMDAYQGALLSYTAARVGLDVEAQLLVDTASSIAPALQAFQTVQARNLEQARERQQAQASRLGVMFAASLLTVALVLIGTLLMVLRAVRRPIQDTLRFAQDIAEDRLDTELRVHNPHDEIGQLAQRLGHMQQQLRARIERDRAVAQENARARQALDSASTGLMVIDPQGIVTHANPALLLTLSRAADEVIGASARDVHTALSSAGGSRRRDFDIQHAGTTWHVVTTPIFDDGHALGEVVEWRSRALEVLLETEVAALVDAAALGELAGRIPLEGKAGFVHRLSASINHLLATFEHNLGDLQTLLAALARGDLRARMDGEVEGVFARMRDDANATVQQLAGIVARIQQAAGSIGEAAGEISAGNADLSTRTELQAANLEETAASMHELTDTVSRNADAASQASVLVQASAEVAARGGDAVGRVQRSMSDISAASRRIGEITSLIDGIAFQTNILALNAAVEAARAGEQGRSFAVVASEVRSLAQRSADAAKQIKGLIEDSVAQVGQGTKAVGQAGATMTELQASVQQVAAIMLQIRDASLEQRNGISQVNQTIVQMDASTQQNAAMVEEATASARALEDQADLLAEAVAVFQLRAAPRAVAA